MRKMLLMVCAAMLLGAFASAQVAPTYYDITYTGYCDGAQLVLQKLAKTGTGNSKVYVAGFHDLANCGGAANFYPPLVGHKAAAGATVPPHNEVGVAGVVLYTADADLDGYENAYTGVQYEFVYDLIHGYSALYRSYAGGDIDYFCCDQGLTNGLPSKAPGAEKPLAGGTFARQK